MGVLAPLLFMKPSRRLVALDFALGIGAPLTRPSDASSPLGERSRGGDPKGRTVGLRPASFRSLPAPMPNPWSNPRAVLQDRKAGFPLVRSIGGRAFSC